MSTPKNTKQIKTSGYVLRRTNYGEADRILNIITPVGKISAVARGVRKAKSKLAGNIELFTLSDYIIHLGRGELGTITSAKMVKYYGGILKDYYRMEFAGEILKQINKYAENSDAIEYFQIVEECFEALDNMVNLGLIEAWFNLNVSKAIGEEPNFYRDIAGEKLSAESRYDWNVVERAFMVNENGKFGADEIKILRLIMTTKLDLIKRIKGIEEKIPDILWISRVMIK